VLVPPGIREHTPRKLAVRRDLAELAREDFRMHRKVVESAAGD
jgi:hypothetical protein